MKDGHSFAICWVVDVSNEGNCEQGSNGLAEVEIREDFLIVNVEVELDASHTIRAKDCGLAMANHR